MAYTSTETRVFWDIADFPIPDGGDVQSFKLNIQKALQAELYHGSVSIVAYTDEEHAFRSEDISMVCTTNDKHKRYSKMLLDMADWALSIPTSGNDTGPNLMVIAKDIPDPDSPFTDLLAVLCKKGYNIFLVVPDEVVELLPTYRKLVCSSMYVWHWGILFRGGPPIDLDTDSESECADEGSSQGLKRPPCEDGSSRVTKSQKTDADVSKN